MKPVHYPQLFEGYRSALLHDDHAVFRFQPLLESFRRLQERQKFERLPVAPSFNVLGVFRLAVNEVRHSMALAWLLDWDSERTGTHSQGNLGFQLFLNAMGLPLEWAYFHYTVNREQAGDESHIDVEIVSRCRFVIHIENKIHAADGYEQAKRERADLDRRAASLAIPKVNVKGVYLKRDGRSHESGFTPVSWSEMAEVFEKFAEQSKPSDVKLFSRHFASCIRYAVTTQDLETTDDEADLERVTEVSDDPMG